MPVPFSILGHLMAAPLWWPAAAAQECGRGGPGGRGEERTRGRAIRRAETRQKEPKKTPQDC